MLLSIIVLSYNRPKQIERILKNFIGFHDKRVRLVIKDDGSPKFDEIQEIYNLYKANINIECILHRNEVNLGYDLNLWTSFWTFDSDYIFLLSDDDYINVKSLPLLMDQLSQRIYSVYFTPYYIDGNIGRFEIEKYNINNFSNNIYNSILFSGLIFKVDDVKSIPLEAKEIDNSIYSQVIISSILIYNDKGFGVAPSGILYVGGDGENYFGKNPKAIEKEKLADRTTTIANLHYQKFLLNSVRKVSEYTSSEIHVQFLKVYKFRLIGYLIKVRSMGIGVYVKFIKDFRKSHAKSYFPHCLLLFILIFCPAFISKVFYKFGLNHLRNDD